MAKKIWNLDKGYEDGEMRALGRAVADLGAEFQRVDWDSFYPRVVNGEVGDDSELLPDVALVNARIFTKHSAGDMALLYDWLGLLERRGVRLVNTARSLQRTHNKVAQAGLLADAGIPVPPTRLAQSPEDVQSCMETWGDVMIKPVMGNSSIDVVKFIPKSYSASGPPNTPFGIREDIVLWNWLQRHQVLCVQKFIENPGRDIRAIVVGGVVASCTYNISTARDGSVRSLLHPSRRTAATLTPELERILVDAVAALELDISCVDLVEGPDGPVVIEVNPALSRWEPIEGTDADLTSDGITAVQATLLCDLAGE